MLSLLTLARALVDWPDADVADAVRELTARGSFQGLTAEQIAEFDGRPATLAALLTLDATAAATRIRAWLSSVYSAGADSIDLGRLANNGDAVLAAVRRAVGAHAIDSPALKVWCAGQEVQADTTFAGDDVELQVHWLGRHAKVLGDYPLQAVAGGPMGLRVPLADCPALSHVLPHDVKLVGSNFVYDQHVRTDYGPFQLVKTVYSTTEQFGRSGMRLGDIQTFESLANPGSGPPPYVVLPMAYLTDD